jgi:hypothetical protein
MGTCEATEDLEANKKECDYYYDRVEVILEERLNKYF